MAGQLPLFTRELDLNFFPPLTPPKESEFFLSPEIEGQPDATLVAVLEIIFLDFSIFNFQKTLPLLSLEL